MNAGGRLYHLCGLESVDAFLARAVPSDPTLPDTWIQSFGVRFPPPPRFNKRLFYNGRVGLEALSQEHLEADPLLVARVLDLARTTGLVVGKWMLRVGGADVDALWSTLVRAAQTADGPLARTSIKVSTHARAQAHARYPGLYTCCVYVPDGTVNEVAALEVRDALVALGAPAYSLTPIQFKPDIFTELRFTGDTWLY